MGAISVKGAIDIHIHSNPSLMDRARDDFEHAKLCRDLGYAGIMFKSHHESTVSRAYFTEKAVPGIKVFGGIVCNWPVGGLNPAAVEAHLSLGAKQVWMPTMHSKAHAELYGIGTYGYQESGLQVEVTPITVLDDTGELVPEVVTIMELCKSYDVIFGTAHLSPEEILPLAKLARDMDFKKFLVTHPTFRPPNLTIEQVEKLVALGAWIELTAGNLSPIPGYGDLNVDRETIERVGVDHIIISTDSGQHRKSAPPEVLRVYNQCLYEKGVTVAELEQMTIHNVRWLLGWEE